MYNPDAFRVESASALGAFIDAYPFATLVTVADGLPVVTHLPLERDGGAGVHGRLLGHMARANPHWRVLAEATSLAIFHGPHAYVSPAWYARQPAVPTWNYAVVHASGTARLIDGVSETGALLDRMMRRHEAGRREPRPAELPEAFRARMTAAVVAFELPLETLEGKFKLGQNRSAEDRRGVLDGLMREGEPGSLALAGFTRRQQTRAPEGSEVPS